MKTMRVLLVEDNEADVVFFRELTREISQLPMTLDVARDLESAIELNRTAQFDVIFLDLGLPGSHGIETFDRLKKHVQSTPIVVFTGSVASDGGVIAVKHGAQDYLVKGHVSSELLAKTMLYATGRSKYQSVKQELDQARVELATIATTKNRFLSNVSHELGTPLTAVLGYLQLLNSSQSLSMPDRDKVDKALSAGRVLQGVVSNIIEAAHMEMEQIGVSRDPVSISDELTRVSENFEARCLAKNVVFKTEAMGSDQVWVDQSKIRFILNALLENAVQFTERGSISVCVVQDDEKVRLEVTDTGSGIEPPLHARLFDSFQHDVDYLKTAGKGAGLSLYICKSYVDAMKGSMTVESDGISGSKFSVVLPGDILGNANENLFDTPELAIAKA